MMRSGTDTDVVDRWKRPAGRAPLSRSSSHSYPTVFAGNVRAGSPSASAVAARLVPRQKRILPSAAGTTRLVDPSLTVKIVPVNPFSGRPPSSGAPKRGSRHEAVASVVEGSCTPALISGNVSLSLTTVRG